MNKNTLWAICFSLLAAVAVTSCRRQEAQEPATPIKIGVLAPFNTHPGEGIRNGVKMAVDEINAAGGIDGRHFEVIEINTEYSPKKAVRGYQRLAGQDRVVAVLGVAGDGIFPIMEQLHRYKVPMITTGCGSDRLTEMVAEDYDRYKWFFRVMHASSELGNATADFAINCLSKRHGLHKFAIMVEDDIWTKYIRDIWVKDLTANPGTEVVFNTTFSSETVDFSVIFQQIIDSGAQYILDACSRVEATTYLKRWAAVDAPPIGAIPTGAGTKRYFDLIGERGLFICSVATIPSPQNPLTDKSAEWSRRYQATYGDAAYTSGYSYDAVHILAEALSGADSTESGALVSALEKTDQQGVAAVWQFSSDHHSKYGQGFREVPIIQYVEANPSGFRVVWPSHRAATDFVLRPRAPSSARRE
jgi:branched-chain amino acid transport system substrate-binding protein